MTWGADILLKVFANVKKKKTMSSSIYNILKFFDIFLDSFEVKNIALQWRRELLPRF